MNRETCFFKWCRKSNGMLEVRGSLSEIMEIITNEWRVINLVTVWHMNFLLTHSHSPYETDWAVGYHFSLLKTRFPFEDSDRKQNNCLTVDSFNRVLCLKANSTSIQSFSQFWKSLWISIGFVWNCRFVILSGDLKMNRLIFYAKQNEMNALE